MSEQQENNKLGLSGSIAKKFLLSEITPLLAVIAFLLGVFAVIITPREEEPQINVTFANIFVPFPGASAKEVEQLVSSPAEQILSELEGIKHIYSVSKPGMSVLTVQFKVGEDRTQAIVRLYNAIYSKSDWLPANLGTLPPIIKPKGIDDVPIVTLTLWTKDQSRGAHELNKVSHALETELKRIKGTRDIYTLGGPEQVVHILLDPAALAAYNLSVTDLRAALQASNTTQPSGNFVSNNKEILVQAGAFLVTADEVKNLVVGVNAGEPIYLRDVANVKRGSDQAEQYAWFGTGPAISTKGINASGEFPAVTIAIAKQPGSNAVGIANNIIQRVEQLKGIYIPQGIEVSVTRNYGETADSKAKQLIGKLGFATFFVVILVFFALGKREALIVGVAVVITLAATLFASWAWGFTLNRVSLFALIFSIGILVDDAIVVVENIHRHMSMGGKKLVEAIPIAVDEVGGPTILATFTVIAALLPMAFVSGLMGPYMSPIPINASMGMLISLIIAFVVTPWLANKVLANQEFHHTESSFDKRLSAKFKQYLSPYLKGDEGSPKRKKLFIIMMALIIISVGLAGIKLVVFKMLPFDNKSEFQIVVDMPEGTPVEQTSRVLRELGLYVSNVPEVTDYQVYVGGASPINFNGLIRQYYLRKGSHLADIQVNLTDKKLRNRKSHEIAAAMRDDLQAIGKKFKANVKVVEVPPGPPVMSPLVTEVYGLDYNGQIDVAKQIRKIFEQTKDIVDVDDTIEFTTSKIIVKVDQQKAAQLGVSQQDVVTTLSAALNGEDTSYLHALDVKYPLPIRLEFSVADKASVQSLFALQVRGANGQMVSLSDIVSIINTNNEQPIYHKDMLPVVFVTADMAGDLDSPLYGMFNILGEISDKLIVGGKPVKQTLLSQPENPYEYSLKWDGEWQITYETFRDMGLAYAVGLLLIYLLVVAQFRSYLVPLIIMAPIPLTIIGVMPGHALLGTQFTATSLIGMIALAGIIVRNSILLVDFINQQVDEGMPFEEAVINSGAVRAKPIVLTGLAAMLGATFIITDPIFSGLAISLIFGILVSTILTLVVIPIMYYAFMHKTMGS